MSANTEPIYITKTIVYNIVGKDDKTEKIEKQKMESVVNIAETSENYAWIKSNNVFISENNNILTLNVLNHLIGAKKVEEKLALKKTSKSKKDKQKEEQNEEEQSEEQNEEQNEEPKKYSGFYLSIVDLSEEFGIKKSVLEAWAKNMDKYTPVCKIVESSNWMHISALPAFLTTFVEKYREIFAEAFNRIVLEQKLDVDELKLITPEHKIQSLELKNKELTFKKEPKEIVTGPDAYKVILITIHDDEEKKYIAINTTMAKNIEKFEKTKSKNGKYKTVKIETTSEKVATKMIQEYLINVKGLEPTEFLNESKSIGTNFLFYEDGKLPSEDEIKKMFDEFTEEYIKEHPTTKPKATKAKQDKDVKLNAPKNKKSAKAKEDKEDKEDKEAKEEQPKPKKPTNKKKQAEKVEKVEEDEEKEESKQEPVKQESEEEDEEFNW